jgi:hypothetical protein
VLWVGGWVVVDDDTGDEYTSVCVCSHEVWQMTSRSDQPLQSARERTSHVGSVGCKRVGDTRARMRTRQWMRDAGGLD